MEDLSAYNTELVARATYACKKPIVSAVGHETDFTIIDFVSDLRAPTPSAAAELLAKDTKSHKMALKKDISRLSRNIDTYIADKTLQFQGTKNIIVSMVEDMVTDKKLQIEKLTNQISSKLNEFVVKRDYELKLKLATLKKLNPLDILSQGYAKIEQNGKPIGLAKNVDFGSQIEINFSDGCVKAMPQNKE